MPDATLMRLDALLDRQHQGWLDGNRPTIESLLAGAPNVDDQDLLLDLIYGEVVAREELGETPTLAEYVARFPHVQLDLELHFEVHRAVEEGLAADTARLNQDESWPDASSPDAHPGQFPAGYNIGGRLGQGGMAVVYRAHDCKLHRDVALKMFDGDRLPTRRQLLRLRTEAEAMARLSHPNIIQIFTVGEVGGRPYLALELAERGTLAQRLQHFRYAPSEAAELIETLARAVAHAHDQQVVHRDLKPANVLFARDGAPKISDFGLAKVFDPVRADERDATRTGEPIGTPRYMAPEQTGEGDAAIGPAADVYALGTLLYECLVGHAPFVATSVLETWRRIREEDPIPPRRLAADIPRDLETICLHCLQKDPARRYASAQELAGDLVRFRKHEPIDARPVPRWERIVKWCRRRPSQAALIALSVVLIVGGIAAAAVGSYLTNQRLRRQRGEVAVLIADGRRALDRDDADTAEARFLAAWRLVQAEPALSDHETSVSGWLDHTRNLASRYRWTERVPPRDFDARRDEAILLAALQAPWQADPVQSALNAIEAARDLTAPDDPAWDDEREQLLWLQVDLLRDAGQTDAALQLLEASPGLVSRILNRQRAELLRLAGRTTEAADWQRQADDLPPNHSADLLRQAVHDLRQGLYGPAISSLDDLLAVEPEHFIARFLLAVAELHEEHVRQAQIALTACIAQRPRFAWNYLYRSRVAAASGNSDAALRDLETALHCRPSDEARAAAMAEQQIARTRHRPGDADGLETQSAEPRPPDE